MALSMQPLKAARHLRIGRINDGAAEKRGNVSLPQANAFFDFGETRRIGNALLPDRLL